MRELTVEEKKTPEMYARAKNNLEQSIAREKEAIEYSATGFVAGYEWHKPYHENVLKKLQGKYEALLRDGYV